MKYWMKRFLKDQEKLYSIQLQPSQYLLQCLLNRLVSILPSNRSMNLSFQRRQLSVVIVVFPIVRLQIDHLMSNWRFRRRLYGSSYSLAQIDGSFCLLRIIRVPDTNVHVMNDKHIVLWHIFIRYDSIRSILSSQKSIAITPKEKEEIP